MAPGCPWISCVALSKTSRVGIGVQPSFQPSTYSNPRTTSEELTLVQGEGTLGPLWQRLLGCSLSFSFLP